MAEPARKYDPDPVVGQDPFNPVPPRLTDPVGADPLMTDIGRTDPVLDNRPVVVSERSGNGLLIGAVIVVLAVVAFYIFGPGSSETVAPPATQPATTEPAAPAPDATAPADPAAPAPNAAAPAETAPAPAEPAPAPTNAAPAEPAPAPAPAPAQ